MRMVWATCGRCRLCACKGAVLAGANAPAAARRETTSHLSMVVVALLLGSAVWRRCYGVERSVCGTSKAVDVAAATRLVLQNSPERLRFILLKNTTAHRLGQKKAHRFCVPSFPAMHDKAQETCNRGLRPGSLLASCEALACQGKGRKGCVLPCCGAITFVRTALFIAETLSIRTPSLRNRRSRAGTQTQRSCNQHPAARTARRWPRARRSS